MKDFFKKYLPFINFIFILTTIVAMLISSIMIIYGILSIYDYSFVICSCALLIFIVYLLDRFINHRKFDFYDYIVFLLIIFAFLSLTNAIDVRTAIYGHLNRNEGLLMILSYYILFLSTRNITNRRYKRIIIAFILVLALVNFLYGFLQVYYPDFSLINVYGSWMYALGFVGNSNFFGTLMTIAYSLSFGLYLTCIFDNSHKGIKSYLFKIGLFILLCIFSFGLIISGCLSAYVAVFLIYVLLIISIIYLLVKKRYSFAVKRLVLLIISFIVLFSSYKIFTLHNDVIDTEIMEFFGQSESLTTGEVDDNFGTGRIYIWKNTLYKIKEHYLTGVGIDNFYFAFYPPLIDSVSGFVVDKAHNDYLQKMLCEGVVSGLVFIIFLLSIFFKKIRVFKDNGNNIMLPLFLAFTAYSIQAFFNISVTRVAPLYFIIMGLLVSKNDANSEVLDEKFSG